MLAAQLASAGAEVELLPPVADDEDAHRDALERGLEADVLVTSGGVSVGPHDLVRAVEGELGVEEVFWRVAVKPGKPLCVRRARRGRSSSGCPGNPVSALVGFELFVRPARARAPGRGGPGPALRAPGRSRRACAGTAQRDELVRARIARSTTATSLLEPVSGQESHMIARAAAADALVLVPRGDGELAAGARVALPRAALSRTAVAAARSPRGRARPPARHAAGAAAPSARADRAARPAARRARRYGRVAVRPSSARSWRGRGQPRRRDEQRGRARRSRRGQRRATYHGASRPRPKRRRARRAAGAGPRSRASSRRRAASGGRSRTCGSQSHACSDGRTKSSAYGFERDDEQRHDAEREQRGRVPGQLAPRAATGRRGSRRSRATSQPTRASSAKHDAGRATGQSRAPARLGRRRPRGAVAASAPSSEKTTNTSADPEPEREPAAVAAQRRRERDPPPPAAREQVDDRGEERQQRGDQHELDRPAAHEPRAEIDVRLAVPCASSSALVERAERAPGPHRPSSPSRAPSSASGVSPNAGGGRVPAGRQRHRRDAAADERRLLVEA